MTFTVLAGVTEVCDIAADNRIDLRGVEELDTQRCEVETYNEADAVRFLRLLSRKGIVYNPGHPRSLYADPTYMAVAQRMYRRARMSRP